MNGKDNPVIFSVKKCFPYINDGWSESTDVCLRPKARLETHSVYSDVVITDRVHDWVKQKGFKRDYCGYAPNWLFGLLNYDYRYEVMIKNGGESFIRHLDEADIISEWASIRVCLRHHYIPDDVSIWLDMLKPLKYFGKDIRNPYYICPKDLREKHDYWLKKERAHQGKKRREMLMKRAKELKKKFEKLKSRYFGISFEKDGLVVSVISSLEDYEEEGREMHNCVFQNEYYIKEKTLCMSAKRDGKHVATIEVNIATWNVVQCRAVCNKECEYAEEIKELIAANKSVLEKAKRKKVA